MIRFVPMCDTVNTYKRKRQRPYKFYPDTYVLFKNEHGKVNTIEIDLFLEVKNYANSTMYNYTPRKLANLTGYNIRTIKNRVQSLIDKGLFKITHRGHLVSISLIKKFYIDYPTKKINTITGRWVDVRNKKQRMLMLNRHMLEHQLNKQTFAQQSKVAYNNYMRQFKKYDTSFIESNHTLGIVTKRNTSARHIANLLGVGKTKANHILNDLSKYGYITKRPIIQYLGKTKELVDYVLYSISDYEYSKNIFKGHVFNHNGSSYLHGGTSVKFNFNFKKLNDEIILNTESTLTPDKKALMRYYKNNNVKSTLTQDKKALMKQTNYFYKTKYNLKKLSKYNYVNDKYNLTGYINPLNIYLNNNNENKRGMWVSNRSGDHV